jgi:hypothetical protein
MDATQLELGVEVARRPPVWAVRYVGLPPREEGALREDWIRRAGIAEGYRELAEHKDVAEAIGELPPTGAAELREAWAAAARALEMPQRKSDGSLGAVWFHSSPCAVRAEHPWITPGRRPINVCARGDKYGHQQVRAGDTILSTTITQAPGFPEHPDGTLRRTPYDAITLIHREGAHLSPATQRMAQLD